MIRVAADGLEALQIEEVVGQESMDVGIEGQPGREELVGPIVGERTGTRVPDWMVRLMRHEGGQCRGDGHFRFRIDEAECGAGIGIDAPAGTAEHEDKEAPAELVDECLKGFRPFGIDAGRQMERGNREQFGSADGPAEQESDVCVGGGVQGYDRQPRIRLECKAVACELFPAVDPGGVGWGEIELMGQVEVGHAGRVGGAGHC